MTDNSFFIELLYMNHLFEFEASIYKYFGETEKRLTELAVQTILKGDRSKLQAIERWTVWDFFLQLDTEYRNLVQQKK